MVVPHSGPSDSQKDERRLVDETGWSLDSTNVVWTVDPAIGGEEQHGRHILVGPEQVPPSVLSHAPS